jgi:hypothetical protein
VITSTERAAGKTASLLLTRLQAIVRQRLRFAKSTLRSAVQFACHISLNGVPFAQQSINPCAIKILAWSSGIRCDSATPARILCKTEGTTRMLTAAKNANLLFARVQSRQIHEHHILGVDRGIGDYHP